MATRSMVQFGYMQGKNLDEFSRTAQIYHHWDGYPESRLVDIKRAIEKAHETYEKSPGMTYRLQATYPSDLAAFYVLSSKDGAGNVEIDEHLHGDIEYLYQVYQMEDSDGKHNFYVRILTTHQPEGEEYDPERFKAFWDNPSVEAMRVQDEGELEQLLVKYKEEE